MDIISKFNLPSYLKGKSFSEASKIIADRFEGRNSQEDVDTLNDLQGRLQQAQDFVKAQQEAKTQPQQPQGMPPQGMPQGQPQGMHQMPDGSMMPGESHQGAMPQESMPQQEGMPQPGGEEQSTNSYMYGGKKEQYNSYNEGGSMLDKLFPKDASGAEGGVGAGGYVAAATGALDLAKTAFGDTGIDTSGAVQAPDVSSVGASAATGAMKGANAGKAFGPWGAGVGAVLGGAAGFFGGKKQNADANEAALNFDLAEHNKITSSYRSGGKLLANMYDEGGHAHPHTDPNNKDLLAEMKAGIRDAKFAQIGVGENALDGIEFRDKQAELDEFNTSFASDLSKTEGIGSNPVTNTNTNTDTDTDSAKFNPGELLRYAPAAMNALQLDQLKPPTKVRLDRMGNRYNEQLVDEKELQNTVQSSVNNNRNAILSSSGGSGSDARANLLASQLQGSKALSGAYQAASGENRQEKRKAQDFKLNVDQMNMGQSNQETNLNLEQQAGYRTNKSKLLSQIGNDLGGIGQEELFKRYPELMGLSYGAKGQHLASAKRKKAQKKAKRKE